MASLHLYVFNVARGLCVFLHTPNNYGVMIDCGCSTDFHPSVWIRNNLKDNLTPYQGYSLAELIVTHPHDDHVEDIELVTNILPPATLKAHQDYSWQQILNPPDGDPSSNAKYYAAWQAAYSTPATQSPPLGINLTNFSLTMEEALTISTNSQHFLNNRSYITVVDYVLPALSATWKVVIAGDNETAGWNMLLQRSDVRAALRGTHFFVTAHHGHESGYSSEIFTAMGGLPLANISSERPRDTSVHDYSQHAKGIVDVNRDTRKHLTTRHDNHIRVELNDDFHYVVRYF